MFAASKSRPADSTALLCEAVVSVRGKLCRKNGNDEVDFEALQMF